MSTAFHLQMDGATEQANQSIGQILRILVDSNCAIGHPNAQ
jgi:hypothetical protein